MAAIRAANARLQRHQPPQDIHNKKQDTSHIGLGFSPEFVSVGKLDFSRSSLFTGKSQTEGALGNVFKLKSR